MSLKNFYKYLFFKLYCFALLQKRNVRNSFLLFATTFETLHLLIIVIILKLQLYKILQHYLFAVGFLLIGFLINYYVFIKTNRIYKIAKHFSKNKIDFIKGNLIFFLYIFLLFAILSLEIYNL